jgi:DNA-binding NtrC family response regulator
MKNIARASVLFVDDEVGVLKAIQRMLADEPYAVRVCDKPERALELILEDAPTVVVADYYMPKMTGPVFLSKVRQIDESIVRLVLTGRPDVGAVLDAVHAGSIYRFLLKPWDEDELRMSLRQAIDHNLLLLERKRLIAEVDRHRETLESLEAHHPGISKLPDRDHSGAFVLTQKDLPKGSQ